MSNDTVRDEARRIVGEKEDTDYRIAPTAHAELYGDAAPEVAAVLRCGPVDSIARDYERIDGQAVRARDEFKTWASRMRWSILAAASASGFLAAKASWAAILGGDEFLSRSWTVVFGIVAVCAGIYAWICQQHVDRRNLLKNWMEKRADAETRRHVYFLTVCREAVDEQRHASPRTLHILLEYVRRYLLLEQCAYYEQRGSEHQRQADRLLSASWYALGAGMLINGVAVVIGLGNERLAAISVFALVANTLAAVLVNKEATDQDRRNAERYGRTRDALTYALSQVDGVHRALDQGDRGKLVRFVEAVVEPLSAEHRQWLASFDARLTALGRLQQELGGTQKTG